MAMPYGASPAGRVRGAGIDFCEHRDTGEFDPTQDIPLEHQSWVPSWWDEFDALCDPTGQGQITEQLPPLYMFKKLTLNGKSIGTTLQVAEKTGKSPTMIRRAFQLKRFGLVEKWLKKGGQS